VQNMLFVLLASFAVRTANSLKLEDFRNTLTTYFDSIKRLAFHSDDTEASFDWVDDFEELLKRELPWWKSFDVYIKEKMPKKYDELIASIEDFVEVIVENETDFLVSDGEELRAEVLLENRGNLTYSIKEIMATYTVRWVDGMQTEYTCRPYMSSDAPLGLSQSFDLLNMYADQVQETLLNPGLDTLHDQVARPFDIEKFNELFRVMAKYVADLPAEQRAPYEDILARIRHQYAEPEIQRKTDSKFPLKFLKFGGFKVGEKT